MEHSCNTIIRADLPISVVIATYKRTDLLIRCLGSLNRQTLDKKLFEIIVVHDGEDTRTEKKIKKSFPQVHYFTRKDQEGLAAARNYGWLIAKGRLIAFTDQDCIPHKNWLREIYQNNTNEQEIAYMGKVTGRREENLEAFPLNAPKAGQLSFITANCICSKAALIRVGGFDERFKMTWRADKDLEFKLMQENIPIKKLEKALVVHPANNTSWGSSVREQKKRMFNALLYKKFPSFYRQMIRERSPLYYYLMILLFFGMMYGMFFSNSTILLITMISYLVLFVWFSFKRLQSTSLTIKNVTEIVVTSFVIPFVSVYWQWYGAFKYRVLFLV
jgi:glycosyltransferase involved in cell wall biosynthesis